MKELLKAIRNNLNRHQAELDFIGKKKTFSIDTSPAKFYDFSSYIPRVANYTTLQLHCHRLLVEHINYLLRILIQIKNIFVNPLNT